MKKLIVILFFLPSFLFGQASLVSIEELTFKSEFEKTVLLDHFTNLRTDYFNLFMANGAVLNESSIAGAKQKVESFIANYKTDKFDSRKHDKKIKSLYADVHESFLSKYELRNHFEDVFDRGYYNCVSASALYGIIFQSLDIPFTIKESPQHVYLIAYPDQERLIVETTTPNANFVLTINPQLKENFVAMLKDSKLISQSEFNASSTNSLFDKYYFRDQSNITLVQLTGIQYANDGLYLLEDKKYLDAFNQFEKAYMFYPSERNAYLAMVAGVQGLTAPKKFNEQEAVVVGKLSRYTSYGITQKMVEGELQNAIQELLFDKGEKDKLSSFFETMLRYVKDESLKLDLAFQYNFEIGRFYYNQARYRDAMPFFENAVGLKPNHLQATSIFISTASYIFRNKSNNDVLSTLETYKEKYPVLLQNNVFNEMLSVAYLKEFENAYEESDPATGEKYRVMFESFIKEHNDLNLTEYTIGKSYSAAAVYYFKKGQHSKARLVLNQGLKVSPDNHELKMRSRMIN